MTQIFSTVFAKQLISTFAQYLQNGQKVTKETGKAKQLLHIFCKTVDLGKDLKQEDGCCQQRAKHVCNFVKVSEFYEN